MKYQQISKISLSYLLRRSLSRLVELHICHANFVLLETAGRSDNL